MGKIVNSFNEDIDYDDVDKNPSEAFNNFSYSVVDESLDDLRQDVIVLEDSVNKGLISRHSSPNTSELALRDMYKQFEDAFGLPIGYSSFKDYINNVAKTTKIQRDILEAVNAKISLDISTKISIQLLITFKTLIERASTMILKQSEGDNAEFTPELVGMVDKCAQWRQQVVDIEREISEKYPDPERSLVKLVDKASRELSGNTSKSEGEKDMGPAINDILEKLKLEYN